MRTLLATVLLFAFSMTAMAQSVVTAEKADNKDAALCFYKQVKLKGYLYANLIGHCAWDPAMNGLSLSLVAVSEDPMEEAQKIELDYISNVNLVENKSGQLQISVSQDSLDSEDNRKSVKKVIYVKSVSPAKGTFSIAIK